MPTRNDAKQRDTTCGYTEGVDGINMIRLLTRHDLASPLRSYGSSCAVSGLVGTAAVSGQLPAVSASS